MGLYKSICIFEGEKVKQFTVADTKKGAVALLRQAGFKVKSTQEVIM